jgi:hypothetical protein
VAELSESQRKRAESRQKRRNKAEAEPSNGDDAQPSDGPGSGEPGHHGVKQAAKVAAGAAAVGAAAAAARALTSSHQDGDNEPSPESDVELEAEGSEHPAEESETADGENAQQRAPEPEQDETEPEQDETEPEEPEPVDGAAPRAARTVIDRGREQLEDLLGRPVESVSSLERTHDGWVLALEVVELSRIPESTDVLASYEMELDDDLNLRRYQQARRYHRGRADRGDDA